MYFRCLIHICNLSWQRSPLTYDRVTTPWCHMTGREVNQRPIKSISLDRSSFILFLKLIMGYRMKFPSNSVPLINPARNDVEIVEIRVPIWPSTFSVRVSYEIFFNFIQFDLYYLHITLIKLLRWVTRVNEFRNEELKTHIRCAVCVPVGIGTMFESRSVERWRRRREGFSCK